MKISRFRKHVHILYGVKFRSIVTLVGWYNEQQRFEGNNCTAYINGDEIAFDEY